MTLKTLSKLVVDNKVQYGQFAQVDDVNYLDARLHLPNGKRLSRAQLRRKVNQFCFIGIHHQRYIVGLAIVNLKLVSNAFVYVFDKLKNQLVETSRLAPLAVGTHVPTTPNSGCMHFRLGLDYVSAAFSKDDIAVKLRMGSIRLRAHITPSKAPMCLCTRTGFSGFTYMQKQNALSCSGRLDFKGNEDISLGGSLASIDWTLGLMRSETFWNWSSISSALPDSTLDTTFGLNLVCGVNDTSFSENACWINNRLVNLPLTIFDYDAQNIMQPWHISSNRQLLTDSHVSLVFTPKAVRSDHTDIKAMASHFSQLIGTYSGEVCLDGKSIVLNDVWGLAEEHYAKW